MTYVNHANPNSYECEFNIPIKLNVPITIHSQVHINAVPVIKQKLPVVIEPDMLLEPEVRAKAPVCYPQNGYDHQTFEYENVMESAEIK